MTERATARWILAGIVLLFLTIPAWAATIPVANTNDFGAGVAVTTVLAIIIQVVAS